MPITASFSRTSSPFNRLTKSVSSVYSHIVIFKNPTDLINPTILLTGATTYSQDVNLHECNYCTLRFTYISGETSTNQYRYYFIRAVRFVRTDVYEFDLTEDVLATYADRLTAMSLFIARTSSDNYHNPTIKDEMAVKSYVPSVTKTLCKDISHQTDMTSISGNYLDWRTTGLLSDSDVLQSGKDFFVINVAYSSDTGLIIGDTEEGSYPSNNTIMEGKTTIKDFPSYITYSCDYQTLLLFINYCQQHSSQASSVISVYRFPFEVPHTDTDLDTIILSNASVNVGTEDITPVFHYCIGKPIVLADFAFRYADIVSYGATYWERGDDDWSLYLPYIGIVHLDIADFSNLDEIQIVYTPILQSNQCLVTITNITRGFQIYINEITLGEEVALTSSNAQDIRDQWIGIGVKTGVSAITDGIKLASMNPLAQMSAVKSIAGNTANIFTSALTTHSKVEGRQTSAVTSRYSYGLPYFICTHVSYIEPEGYGMRFGYPCMGTVLLSDIQETDSDVFIVTDIKYLPTEVGNETERNEIIRLLNQGVILPPR